MTRTTEVQVIRALVQTLRANNSGFAAQVASDAISTNGVAHTWDSNRINEGTAPDDTPYPFFAYRLVYAPSEDDWTKRTIIAGIDVEAVSDNQVEASNLDQLGMQTLEDSLAAVSGQTTLYCRSISGFRLQEIDQTGKRIFRVGHTYQIWTDQPL